ncbi:MAG: glycosyltransferase family 4 protein [Bryobacteraceae bacterium]
MVAVGSRWTREDLIRHYGLPEQKVQVVATAPLIEAFDNLTAEEIVRVGEGLGLPGEFLLYPAQTWPHKNRLGLLEALRVLRERSGLAPPLVCTGYRNDFYPSIAKRVRELGLERQVVFPGVVSRRELVCLYRACRAVVIPTRFEAVSFPLWEAFAAGVPAACSRVTSLPEQAGDAALLFDLDDVEAMAEAILRLWTDGELRRELAERGRRRAAYSWERTARLFRAHYRRLAGSRLVQEDEQLLAAPAPV